MKPWKLGSRIVPDQVLEACLGALIGEGSRRAVYRYSTDVRFVLKREKKLPPIENIVEWVLWNELRDSSYSIHLGKLFAISESGRFLVMERLESISLNDYAKSPDVPLWLADVKPDMFGKNVEGLVKVRDYGNLKFDVDRLARKPWQID